MLGSDAANVQGVFVDGHPRKWERTLVGVDVAGLRREVEASRDYLLEQVGRRVEVTA